MAAFGRAKQEEFSLNYFSRGVTFMLIQFGSLLERQDFENETSTLVDLIK